MIHFDRESRSEISQSSHHMKTSLSFFAILMSMLLLPAMAGEKSPDGAVHVKADAAAKLIVENKIIVLDVRTADEFAEGHLAGAVNLDFLEGDKFEASVSKLDKTKSYLVHCQSGGRSGRSLKTFQKLGFESIYHLDGGFGGWQAAGKPVTK